MHENIPLQRRRSKSFVYDDYDPNDGVITGAKALGNHQSRGGEIRQTETRYYPRTRTPPTNRGGMNATDYVSYDKGQQFQVSPNILSPGGVVLNYEFSYSGFLTGSQADDGTPPATATWNWSGTASVNAGEPTIVGATQDQTSAFFLILTAHMESST